MRLVRLQGFRDDDAEQALRSYVGGRLAPALLGNESKKTATEVV